MGQIVPSDSYSPHYEDCPRCGSNYVATEDYPEDNTCVYVCADCGHSWEEVVDED
jgi:DNA-directed RNA polymerase subunit RPC12/RpoP